MLSKLFDKILHEDEDLEDKPKKTKKKLNPRPKWFKVVLVFFLALIPRLIHLFIITKPEGVAIDWYGDVFHHWQIAYLSKEIGFTHGFLRLWDLKGMEYYWGLLHPLALIFGFIISGSVGILVPRMISVIFSSLAITLIFLICSRFFNQKTGFFSALFLSLMPVTLFSDTLGMPEPLGLFFLLLGVYLLQSAPAFSGISWMLAAMVRAEYWLFSLGMILAVIIRGKDVERKVQAMIGYGVFLLIYLKYMLDHTGNAIYPIYYNFLATVAGDWFDKTVILTPKVLLIKPVCQGLAIMFFLIGFYVLWRRPKAYLLYLLGLANLTFIFTVFGFGFYLYGYPDDPFFHIIDKLWVDRLMAWPYGFLGILIAIFLFYTVKKINNHFITKLVTSVTFLVILGLTQLIWPSLNYHYTRALPSIEINKESAAIIARNFENKGTIIIPEGRPVTTYFLVNQENISGKKLVSQMYDPFFYYKGEDPYEDWGEFRKEIIDWLQEQNAELIVITSDWNHKYKKMFFLEEDKLFKLVDKGASLKIYQVLF
ncbi:hypothetical protein ACFLZ1_02270 [Patescibacteria group bacterium]